MAVVVAIVAVLIAVLSGFGVESRGVAFGGPRIAPEPSGIPIQSRE
jgi:hypothetical protein